MESIPEDRDGIAREEDRNKPPPANPPGRRQSAGGQSQFSLAGPNPWRSPWQSNNTYVQSEYEQLNPQYGPRSPDDMPVWSLAQPLPHIVRPGMQRGVLPEDRKEDSAHPNAGESERKTEQEAVDAQQGTVEAAEGPQIAAADQRGFFNTWCKIRYYLREPLAEWLGVSIGKGHQDV
jgi:aquaglyceroporin related protein